MLPVPPAPAIPDQRVIDVGPFGQKHIGNGAPAFVLAVGVQRDLISEHKLRSGLIGALAVGLACSLTLREA
jgi:hypothetical protein